MQKKRMAGRSKSSARDAARPADTAIEAATALVEAEKLRLQGKPDKARRICASLLARFPDYAGAHHTLGLVYADMHNYAQALTHLVQASMHNPDNWMTLTALSGVYLRLGAPVTAARTLEQARQLKPDDAGILVTLGEIYRDNRDYEAAAEAYREAIALDGKLAAAQFGLGLCLLELGELEEGARLFDALVAAGHGTIGALNALSELPRALVSTNVLERLETVERAPDQTRDYFDQARAFTRAAALDQAGRHEEAWAELVAANASVAPSFREEWRKEDEINRVVLAGVRAATASAPRPAIDEAHPVSLFILGTSRSGKTTLERLIGTQPGVKCGYENLIVETSVRRTFQEANMPNRDRAIELPPPLDTAWRDNYLAALSRRAGSARLLTNTNPSQILNALRIATVLPNVRLLFVKRDPDDTALRVFMKKYRSGNAYAYDLAHVRAHIDWYHRMIDALAEKLPAISRVVRYEDMVADPATTLETACTLCGLPGPEGPVTSAGDDRGCSAPYKAYL